MMLRMALYTVKWFTSPPFPPPNPTSFFHQDLSSSIFCILLPAASLSLSLSSQSPFPCRSFLFYFLRFPNFYKAPHSLPKPSNPPHSPNPRVRFIYFYFLLLFFSFCMFFVSKTKPLYSDIIEVSVDLTIICTCIVHVHVPRCWTDIHIGG